MLKNNFLTKNVDDEKPLSKNVLENLISIVESGWKWTGQRGESGRSVKSGAVGVDGLLVES